MQSESNKAWGLNNVYLPECGPYGDISNFFGIETDVVIFSRLENLFKCTTKIFGKRYTVMSFSILSTALHLLHLYPHFSIRSEATKFFRQSSKSSPPILYLLGIGNDKSMKLSKVKLWYPHFWHSILLHSWPSKRSVIIELSLSLKYWCQTSDYCNAGSLSQSIYLYFGFFFTRFNSLCIPSNMNRRNSYESCWP